jgi:DNA repair protein RadC
MSHNLEKLFKVSEIEITYRNKIPFDKRIQITSPEAAYQVLIECWDPGKIELIEQCKILLLDQKSNCLGISEVSYGSMTSCLVDPKVVFVTALKAKATRIIIAHNHPTGMLHPSKADIELTKRMMEAGSLLDLPVTDHLIVTSQGYYSFAEQGFEDDFAHSRTTPTLTM